MSGYNPLVHRPVQTGACSCGQKVWIWRRVLKHLVFFLLILLFCLCENDASIYNIPPAGSRLVHVRNPGEGNDIAPYLKLAWEMASPGDTILLPSGNFKFRGELLLKAYDKPGIHLKGAGRGVNGTCLYRDTETPDYMIKVHGSAVPVSEARIEISGICFQAMKTRLYEGDRGTGYPLFR